MQGDTGARDGAVLQRRRRSRRPRLRDRGARHGGQALPRRRHAHRHGRARRCRSSSRARPRTSSSSRGRASPIPQTGQPDMRAARRVARRAPGGGTRDPGCGHGAAARPAMPQCTYNGIHSFRWVNADGEGRFVRYRWEPEAGVETLTAEEARALGHDYLQEEILGAAGSPGGAAFRLVVTLAEPGDPVDDPTAAWPEDREQVVVGRLELTGPEHGARAGRRRAGVRPDAGGRRHRALGGPDPALPPPRLRRLGRAAQRHEARSNRSPSRAPRPRAAAPAVRGPAPPSPARGSCSAPSRGPPRSEDTVRPPPIRPRSAS